MFRILLFRDDRSAAQRAVEEFAETGDCDDYASEEFRVQADVARKAS